MLRRSVTGTLLVILAVQLIGGVAFAPVCFEPCPDDTGGQTCPPVCTLCTSCTRAQQAIVDATAGAGPAVAAGSILSFQPAASPATRGDDIFHVPLPG